MGQANNKVYDFVHTMPRYPGEQPALIKDFIDEFTYPSGSELQTFFNFKFVIDKKGRLLMPQVNGKSDFELNPAEKEGIRVINNLKRWIPGRLNGRRVLVRMSLNIRL